MHTTILNILRTNCVCHDGTWYLITDLNMYASRHSPIEQINSSHIGLAKHCIMHVGTSIHIFNFWLFPKLEIIVV